MISYYYDNSLHLTYTIIFILIPIICFPSHFLPYLFYSFSFFSTAEKFEAEVAERVTSWTGKQKKKRQEVRTFYHILLYSHMRSISFSLTVQYCTAPHHTFSFIIPSLSSLSMLTSHSSHIC